MRFIGSKRLLLDNIENQIKNYIPHWENLNTFCDLFAGTGIVGKHFKKYFKIISNDLLFFSYAIQKTEIGLNKTPKFEELKKYIGKDPLQFLNNEINYCCERYFIAENYSPYSGSLRKYLTESNSLKIDFWRQRLNKWNELDLISEGEYFYILSAIINSVPFVSNIAGTYGAFLKTWDKRAFKNIFLEKPLIYNNQRNNENYNQDANLLIDEIEGDILYIDPPYNSRQYLPNYHLLETIAKYDNPVLKGLTGIRDINKQEKSQYCSKLYAENILFELIKKAKFKYILISYNNEGIIPEENLDYKLMEISKGIFKKKIYPYRRYKRIKDKVNFQLNELLYLIEK